MIALNNAVGIILAKTFFIEKQAIYINVTVILILWFYVFVSIGK